MKYNKGIPLNDSRNAVRVEVVGASAGGTNGGETSEGNDATSTQRTPAFLNVTNSGTIAAGSQSVAIANIGNAAGVVMGTSLPAGTSVAWAANNGDTLAAIAYNATGTAFLITTVA